MLETNTRGTEIFPMNEPIQGRKPYSRLHGLPLVVAAIFVGLAGLLAAPESPAPVPDRPAVVEVTPTPETSEPPVTPAPVTPAPPVTPPVTPAPVTISPEPVTPTPGEPTDPPFNPYYPPVTRPPVTPRPPVVDPTPTYKAPALNGVSSQMGNIDGAVDYFIYGFDLTHNDVDLEKGVSVTMQVRDIGASGWSTPAETYITIPTATYTGAGGAELTYNSEDITIPDGEIGAVQEVQLVFDYTLTDGSTAGQIQSWSVGPLYAYAGSFVYPGNANTTDSEITASFPLLSTLPNPSGSTVSLGGVELIPPTGGTPIVLDADSATVSVDASGGSPTVSVTVSTGDADPGDYVLRAYFVYEDEANNFPAWYSAGQADVTVPVHYDAPEFVADATGGEFDGETVANVFFNITLNGASGQAGTAALYRKNANGGYEPLDGAALPYDGTPGDTWGDGFFDEHDPPMLQWYRVRFNYAFPGDASADRYIESDEIPVWGGQYLIADEEHSGAAASGLTAAFTVDQVIQDTTKFTVDSAVLYCPKGASQPQFDVSDLVTVNTDGTVRVNVDFTDGRFADFTGAPGEYRVELTLTYKDGVISWPNTSDISVTPPIAYIEPFFVDGSVQGTYDGSAANITFDITLEDAAGQEGTATLYKKNDEGSYEALDGVDMTYEGGDATEWPGESGEPLSDAGVAGDGIDWYKVVFEFELPNGNTGSIESDPIPVTHGHYLSATGTPTVFSGFRAEFTIDDKVVDPAGVDPEKITAELETGEGTIDVSGYVSVSDNTITVEALFYEDLHITAPKLGELWTLTVSTVYEADTDDGSVTWPDNAMHTLAVQPAPFEAPEPGTLSTDPVGGDVQTVSAPLTLKSAQGGTVTAQLGELSDGAFHDLYGQTLSISGEESEVVSWTAQFEDFDLASLTEEDGCIVVPVVVRFGYEYSEYVDVPGEGPFSAYTDPLTLYYGNYLLGGEGTDEFYFNEEITAEFPLHEALPDPSGDTLSIVKAEVVSEDGEETVDVKEDATITVEDRDGETVAVITFTTEKELFLGYCQLMVTLSYTDDEITGWQSTNFADLDLMEPPQSFTAPTVDIFEYDQADNDWLFSFEMTLNGAKGGSITATLGQLNNGKFYSLPGSEPAEYDDDGEDYWQDGFDYHPTSLDEMGGILDAVVRFEYEAPTGETGTIDKPVSLFWGTFIGDGEFGTHYNEEDPSQSSLSGSFEILSGLDPSKIHLNYFNITDSSTWDIVPLENNPNIRFITENGITEIVFELFGTDVPRLTGEYFVDFSLTYDLTHPTTQSNVWEAYSSGDLYIY